MNKKIFLSLTILILILLSHGVLGANWNKGTNNLVNYFTFDNVDTDGSIAIGYNNTGNGTITGATTGEVGIVNEDYNFTIGNRVQSTNWVSNYPVTMNAWIKKDNDGVFGTIGGLGDESASNVYYYFAVSADNFPICVSRNTATQSADSGTDISGGDWHMITCVLVSSTLREIWVDGVFKASNTGSSSWNANVDVGKIGVLPNSGNALGFDGGIDEFGVWNVRLNQTDIEFLNASGAPIEGVNTPPFVAAEDLSIDNSTYNMTSDGGCINWRTNTSNNCDTTDGTPTFIFDTNRDANCSVRASISDSESFPVFNSSFACGTTDSTSHICTVYNGDKLAFGQNYLYASCSDGGNATSEPLAINMTAGEGGGLIDCINVVGSGCAAVITGSCAAIIIP